MIRGSIHFISMWKFKMDIELTGEELRWMYSVFQGEFKIIPKRVVNSVISKGLGVPNLGGAFNLTRAGKEVFRRTPLRNNGVDEGDELHIIHSKVKHRTNWRLG